MKSVSNILFFLFVSLNVAFSQTSSSKLKKEQAQLEKKIANTKSLIEKTKSNTQTTYNELKLLDNQVKFREKLLRNYDNQIRSAELKIAEKNAKINELTQRIEKLKRQYKQLLIYAYKHRNKYGKMMYIFSSKSYHEAIKRRKYLEKIQEIQKKQFHVIEQNKKLIREQLRQIELEKAQKAKVIVQKRSEKQQIASDKVAVEKMYKKFKSEEKELLAKLHEEERQKANLKAKIASAIKRELAAEAARRRKAELGARKKAAAEGKAVSETKVSLAETKEATALSKSFANNRGKLPWPVERGAVTEKYGKNPHPTIPNVYTNNNGVDISAPKHAQVRSVFSGEVTSVLNIPGAGKVVIVKHGNYRTVYSNLQNVYVKKGSSVKTKQVIGALLSSGNEKISKAHFEIHFAQGSSVKSLNPELWIAR